MEKKNKLKNRVFSGLLALTLAGCKPIIVKAEEELVQEEVQVKLIDMFKMQDADLSEPNFDGFEYEYVSDDGKESKYYISYLKEIDGLKRTNNKRETNDLFSYNKSEYEFKGDYCYLYYDSEFGYLVPLFSKDLSVTINDVEYLRTNIISSATQEQIDILLETDTYRLTDNSVRLLPVAIKKRIRDGFIGAGIMEPLEITDDALTGKMDYVNQSDKVYDETYDGYLIGPYFAQVSYNFLDNTEEEKIMTLKRNK